MDCLRYSEESTSERVAVDFLIQCIPRQFAEAYEWGNLAIELCEKHYAQSRFADRGEVWEIFYCTAPFSRLRAFVSPLLILVFAVAYINWLKHPLLESVHGLEMGFKHAVAGGNPAFGTGCAYNLVGTFWYAVPLPQLVSSVGKPSIKILSFAIAAHSDERQDLISDTLKRPDGRTCTRCSSPSSATLSY